MTFPGQYSLYTRSCNLITGYIWGGKGKRIRRIGESCGKRGLYVSQE